MPKSNKERLQDNNLELQDIKAGIDNLPDYQDVQPIYDYRNYAVYNTKTSSVITFYKNYFVVSSGDYYILKKIDSNGDIITFPQNLGGNYSGGIAILHIDEVNNKLYYFHCYYYFTVYLKEYDLETNQITQLNQYNEQQFMQQEAPLSWGLQGKLATYNYMYSYGFNYNINNSTISKFNMSGYDKCFNEDIIIKHEGKTIKNLINNTTYTSSSVINFINKFSNKIILNNNLYYLSNTLVIGELIKQNIFNDYESDFISVNLFGDFYYVYKLSTNGSSGILYKFNEDTNTFIEQQQITNAVLQIRNLYYKNSLNQVIYVQGDEQTELIGYKIDDEKIYLHQDIGINSNKIAQGTICYDYSGHQINGTMPNNGVLNYTPSNIVQTIPEGYTSGGTVAAIDYSGQGALSPADTATAEAQIEDLFGEGE